MSRAGTGDKGTDQGSMQRNPDTDSRFDAVRRGHFRALRIPLSIALLSAGLSGNMPATAQVAATPPAPASSPSPDEIKQREQEL